MFNFNKLFGPDNAPSRSIPSNLLAPELGEVSLRQVGDRLQVAATIAMGAFVLGDGERCIAGLALDASQSMRDGYGRGRTIPPEIRKAMIEQGKFEEEVVDGVTRRVLPKALKEEIVRSGQVIPTKNIVHQPCITMIENMIRTFATGGITAGQCEVVYWACGTDGAQLESLGELRQGQLAGITIDGPHTKPFGQHTLLAPPLRYFAEKAKTTSGVFVFITDGHIEDEAAVVAETHRLAAEILRGQRKSIKCVLLGIGREVDRAQLKRLDDMEMPGELSDIDVFNTKVLAEMRDMNDAWSEIFDPETVVGTSLKVFDDQGRVAHEKTDEVKALIPFTMPVGSAYFELVLDGEMRIRQQLV